MSAGDLLRLDLTRRTALMHAWSDLFKQLRKAQKKCDASLTGKRVHRLRLAARHCLPVLEVLRTMPHGAPWNRLYERLSDLLDALGALRDAQVRRLQLETIAPRVPRALNERITAEELAAHPLVRWTLSRLEFPKDGLHGAASGRLIRDGKHFGEAVRRTIALRQQRLVERWERIDLDDPMTLHRARVALKRYRYTLLALEPCLSVSKRRRLPRMKSIQGTIGDWHDAHLFGEWLLSTGSAREELIERSTKRGLRYERRVEQLIKRSPPL